MLFWFLSRTARERRIQRELARTRDHLADTVAELEAERRRSRIKDAEIQTLSAVVARDRQRIESETASYARKQAEAEGTKK